MNAAIGADDLDAASRTERERERPMRGFFEAGARPVDRAASLLLRSTDDKLASIAARIGVNEGTLAELIRDRFGVTSAEYRRTLHQR